MAHLELLCTNQYWHLQEELAVIRMQPGLAVLEEMEHMVAVAEGVEAELQAEAMVEKVEMD
jgi:hypothetical protein